MRISAQPCAAVASISKGVQIFPRFFFFFFLPRKGGPKNKQTKTKETQDVVVAALHLPGRAVPPLTPSHCHRHGSRMHTAGVRRLCGSVSPARFGARCQVRVLKHIISRTFSHKKKKKKKRKDCGMSKAKNRASSSPENRRTPPPTQNRTADPKNGTKTRKNHPPRR
jgi:hypothetical protein